MNTAEQLEKKSSSESNMTRLSSYKKGSTRISALFHFVQDETATLTKQGLEPKAIKDPTTQEPTAYCIQLPLYGTDTSPAPINAFEDRGYVCIDRHLRIDKFWKTENAEQNKGLMYTHYTERHKHPTNNNLLVIVVHVYSNKDGEEIYREIKEEVQEPNSANTTKPPLVHLTEEIRQAISTNARAGKTLFDQLNDQLMQNFNKEYDALVALEERLSNFSKDFNNASNTTDYIEGAKQYAKHVDKLNAYNNTELFSAEKISEISKKLENFEIQSHNNKRYRSDDTTLTSTEIPDSQIEPDEVEISNVTDLKEKEESTQLKKSLAEILILEKQLNTLLSIISSSTAPVLKDQILTRMKAEEIQQKLFDLILTKDYDAPLEQKRQKIMARISQKTSAIPSASDLLYRCINPLNEHSFTNVKLIFPYVKLTDSFIINLLLMPIYWDAPTVNDSCEPFKAICCYLFDNSQYYKNAVRNISRLVHPIQMDLDRTVSCSIFALYMSPKLFDIFIMLLEHGANPNIPGLFLNNFTPYSLLRTSIYMDKPQFIQVLLNHGATIDYVCEIPKVTIYGAKKIFKTDDKNIKSDAFPRINDTKPKHSRTAANPIIPDPSTNEMNSANTISHGMYSRLLATGSVKYDLYIACYQNRMACAMPLIKKSDLTSLVTSLACLANKTELDTFPIRIQHDNNLFQIACVNVLRPNQQIVFDAILNKFYPVLMNASQEKINSALLKLEAQIGLLTAENQTLILYDYYLACLYLMSNRKLTIEDTKKVMLLLWKMGNLFCDPKVPAELFISRGIANLQKAMGIAEGFTEFKKTLINTSHVYEACAKKIEQLKMVTQLKLIEQQATNKIKLSRVLSSSPSPITPIIRQLDITNSVRSLPSGPLATDATNQDSKKSEETASSKKKKKKKKKK